MLLYAYIHLVVTITFINSCYEIKRCLDLGLFQTACDLEVLEGHECLLFLRNPWISVFS